MRSMEQLLSPEQSFEVIEGQVVGFSCHPRSLTPLIFTRIALAARGAAVAPVLSISNLYRTAGSREALIRAA